MRIIIKEKGVDYAAKDAPVISTPEDAASQLRDIADSYTEAFCVILLNARNRMISSEIVTMGLANSSLVHPREVFRSAVKAGACAVILAHNHPSGDITPSAEDMRITKQLVEAGKILDIKVLDHVIIGRESHTSMLEEGLTQFG